MIAMNRRSAFFALVTLAVAGCSTAPTKKKIAKAKPKRKPIVLSSIKADGASREILMYTMGLLDVDYRFGGNNPEAGLDCSGMVVYIYKNAVGLSLPRTAAEIAEVSTPVSRSQLRVGDLVFFNTLGRSYSHMGLYIGDNKFVHAPRTNSTIRTELLTTPYFASRFEGGRTLFAL